ncbi:hypothetical protein LO772_04380 [Yinghuangia sp. ASG 101]|uniref:hypothetical protein n=1 Tax=Yinghuangia sp. ASG 101 TaxID=2896848 RepID=UPI001E2C9B8E|nr:hypothetical protein [Yinghuangia sp. ASG 101]UGQ12863.1 hypothetical protein LO772_04380 [Yinghuangia sp. ASG 101]
MRTLVRIIAPRWYARWSQARSATRHPAAHLTPAPVRRARARFTWIADPRRAARRRVEDEVVREVRRRLR